ncbi:MAG: SDR family oxidoreductase [Pseudomonadota bacterium]
MSAFHDKIVLVTGGRSGIGLACANLFAERGARVITAQRGVAEQHETIQTDFADTGATTSLIDQLIEQAGRLDVLVNNAGIMQEATVEEMSLADWEATLRVNLTAPFLLAKHAMPHLKKSSGNIVNVGSIEGLGSNPTHPAYCASKAGLHGLTRAIAVDHGPDGVRCNAVAPGWIDTELNTEFVASQPNAETFMERLAHIHPVGRTGKPQEVASLIAFLASDEAKFITGQIWTIDGGRMSKLSLP